MNTVQAGSFLTLHYRLSGPDGVDVINTFNDKPATLSLGAGQLAPAFEQLLIGLPDGARQTFELPAGVAFGERNPDMVQRVKRALVDDLSDDGTEYTIGDVVRFPTPDGAAGFAGVLREVGDGWMLFDFNHPLAGRPVRFEVQLLGVM